MRTVADPKTPTDSPGYLTERWDPDDYSEELATPVPSDVFNLIEDIGDALARLASRLELARDLTARKKPKRQRRSKAGGP